MNQPIAALVICGALLGGLAACDNKGPVEKAGMKVDHTVDAIKNGGHETAGDKAEDAAEHVKDGVKDAADDLKK